MKKFITVSALFLLTSCSQEVLESENKGKLLCEDRGGLEEVIEYEYIKLIAVTCLDGTRIEFNSEDFANIEVE